MQEWLTVKDFIIRFGVPESTLRGWIKKDRLTVSSEIIDKRKTKIIFLDEKARLAVGEYKNFAAVGVKFNFSEIDNTATFAANDETVQDAEIVKESNTATNFDIVTNESVAFEKMIQSLKDFADERAKTLEEVNKHAHSEIFELKSEIKQLYEEIKQLNQKLTDEKIKAAQAEAELKISFLKISELEEKNKSLEEKIFLNINKTNFWHKKL